VRGRDRSAGFTLLEISVVLVIIALVVGGGLSLLVASAKSAQFNGTVAKMDAIQKALLQYRVAFNRIPCPGDLTLTASSSNYGTEGANQGTCTGGTPAANYSGSGVAEGAVPTGALRLPDDYMYDAWGHRFRYAVSVNMTAASPFSGACPTGAITVNDATETARTTDAAYALISHGANGHGGFTSNGVVYNGGSTNADELTNCHCNSSGSATTYSGTYVEKLPTASSGTYTNSFDDIVTFGEAWQQLQTPQTYASASTCNTTEYIYVLDAGNNRVEKFSSSGTFISQFPCASGTCSGSDTAGLIGAAVQLAADSNNNLYVWGWGGGGYWTTVQKFSSGGSYIGTVLSPSYGYTSNYTWTNCNSCFAIAVDSSGNIWEADAGNNRVLEYNSSGTYLQTMPSSGCTLGNNPVCPASSPNGEFDLPAEIRFDSSGNMYVAPDYGYYIQKYNSGGSLITSWHPNLNIMDFTVDSSGNYWLADWGYESVDKFNSSGSLVLRIGGTVNYSDPCPTQGGGVANGQFCVPANVALDPSGNVWVVDGNNNRIQEFNSSGSWLLTIPSSGCTGSSPPACPYGSANGQFNFSNSPSPSWLGLVIINPTSR
jgi:prepilin-type N-terminal cleavage/methylation domain-containing protein